MSLVKDLAGPTCARFDPTPLMRSELGFIIKREG